MTHGDYGTLNLVFKGADVSHRGERATTLAWPAACSFPPFVPATYSPPPPSPSATLPLLNATPLLHINPTVIFYPTYHRQMADPPCVLLLLNKLTYSPSGCSSTLGENFPHMTGSSEFDAEVGGERFWKFSLELPFFSNSRPAGQ